MEKSNIHKLNMNNRNYSKFIDHSPLKMDASETEIIQFCNEAIEYSFYAMVVFPYYIDALLKVILEVELLSDEEIVKACNIVAESGADFVKTSVGLLRGSKPATVDRVKLMHDTVSQRGLKVKASGGIHSTEIFLAMIEAGASRVGTSKGIELLTGLKGGTHSIDY